MLKQLLSIKDLIACLNMMFDLDRLASSLRLFHNLIAFTEMQHAFYIVLNLGF